MVYVASLHERREGWKRSLVFVSFASVRFHESLCNFSIAFSVTTAPLLHTLLVSSLSIDFQD